MLSDDELDFYDAPALVWIQVRDAIKMLWSENPKLHDLGGVITSIQKHGFQDLPKFDSLLPNIENGQGAIKSGNGRIEALAKMENSKMPLPRGLATVKETGAWAMPLIIGTDAVSLAMARSYAIDANNLTMAGGDFDALDMAKMWNAKSYLEVLGKLGEGELPVTVDAQDMDILLRALSPSDTAQDVRGTLLDKFRDFGVKDVETLAYEYGDAYLLGGRHIAVYTDIFNNWSDYAKYLTDGKVFIPFPGAYILATKIAEDKDLVLVQSEPFLFGLLLDSAERVYGEKAKKL